MSNIIKNLDTFEEDIKKGVSLVDFYADWCGPCKMIAPHIEDVASRYDGKAKVFKVNIDEQRELATKYGIRSIPTLLFFKDGEVAEQRVGFQNADSISETLEEVLDN